MGLCVVGGGGVQKELGSMWVYEELARRKSTTEEVGGS